MSEKWHQEYLAQLGMQPFEQLEQLFALSQFDQWPNAQGLNQLAQKGGVQGIPEFVCQSQLADMQDYYEQIIFERNLVPTRPNSWHDLFNGLIWLQFPRTKGLLNQQHMQDIQQFGVSPRSKRRNTITHFDECGVVLTYEAGDIKGKTAIQQLALHQWQNALVKERQLWGTQINSFVFGHANLEMLLNPFIGLTGKWLAIEVSAGFSKKDYSQQVLEVDQILHKIISEQGIFAQSKPLKPIPLLGIPGYWAVNQDPEFYTNTDYFRPLPKQPN